MEVKRSELYLPQLEAQVTYVHQTLTSPSRRRRGVLYRARSTMLPEYKNPFVVTYARTSSTTAPPAQYTPSTTPSTSHPKRPHSPS
jgi:hypothetical protein